MIALLLVLACDEREAEQNLVQDSARATPTWFVNAGAEGFAPECKAVPNGDTVQWENEQPEVPTNVTSLDEPPELYSPNLQGEYVIWSHSFPDIGYYEYYDTNSGDPGRKIVDAYYGTVTYVGTSATTNRGAICVRDPAAPRLGACCCSALDCDVGQSCTLNVCDE
jgi:plastocyanin